ncbi:MAG: hypothetical protein Q9188_002095 [Gyalolechia gomerana]
MADKENRIGHSRQQTPPNPNSPHTVPESTTESDSSSSTLSHEASETNRINKHSQDSLHRQWIKDHDAVANAADYSDSLASPLLNSKRSICVPGGNLYTYYNKTFPTLEEYEAWHTPIAEKVDDDGRKPTGACGVQDGYWRCPRCRYVDEEDVCELELWLDCDIKCPRCKRFDRRGDDEVEGEMMT